MFSFHYLNSKIILGQLWLLLFSKRFIVIHTSMYNTYILLFLPNHCHIKCLSSGKCIPSLFVLCYTKSTSLFNGNPSVLSFSNSNHAFSSCVIITSPPNHRSWTIPLFTLTIPRNYSYQHLFDIEYYSYLPTHSMTPVINFYLYYWPLLFIQFCIISTFECGNSYSPLLVNQPWQKNIPSQFSVCPSTYIQSYWWVLDLSVGNICSISPISKMRAKCFGEIVGKTHFLNIIFWGNHYLPPDLLV